MNNAFHQKINTLKVMFSSMMLILLCIFFSFCYLFIVYVSEGNPGDSFLVVGLEYLLGFLQLAALTSAVIEDTVYKSIKHVLTVIASVLVLNLLMPLFVKSLLLLIIAGALFAALGGVIISILGPVTSVIGGLSMYLSGTLGAFLLVLLVIALVFASSMSCGW